MPRRLRRLAMTPAGGTKDEGTGNGGRAAEHPQGLRRAAAPTGPVEERRDER